MTAAQKAYVKALGVLLAGSFLGSLGVLPYVLQLLRAQLPPDGPPLPLLLAASAAQSTVLAGLFAALGLWLGERVGLGAPLLKAWLAGDPAAPRAFLASLPLSVGLGLGSAAVLLALELAVFLPRLPPSLLAAVRELSPPPWQGLLASLYGGINEEILLRLGTMTVLAWAGVKVTRSAAPGPGVIWTANALAALLFGLGHLPATAALAPLTPVVVVRALVLNGIVGVVCGWLYWRRSLLAAMVAHFSADVVLHGLGPLLTRPAP